MRIHLRRLLGRADANGTHRNRPDAAGAGSNCVPAAVAVLAALLAFVPAGCGNGHASSKPAALVSKTFPDLGDSYVRASDPHTNYGNNGEIFVDGSPKVRAYLSFQPVGLSGGIEHAKLRLYSLATSTEGFQVRETAGGWTEAGITYANAPPVGALINLSASFAENHWISIDVTSAVRKHQASVQLALVTLGPTALTIASRSDPHHAPQLVVDYRP
jgi:hypothetical protein